MSIADRSAAGAGISQSAARGLASTYLGAGVSGNALDSTIGLTQGFGRKLGLSSDEAASTLAGALADPARGAEDLAKKFGLLSYSQREEIAQTAAMGDRAGATAKLVNGLKEQLAKLEDPTWNVGKALDDLKSKASDFISAIGRGVAGGEVENEFQRQARYAQAQQNLASGKLDQGIARQLELDKLAQDAAFAAKEIGAETYAQREAIAMEKARVNTLRETKDATQATMAAEAERLRMLAEAQRKVDDYTRSGEKDRFISGATNPLERRLRQIQAEWQELLKQIPETIAKHISTPRARSAPASSSIGGGTGDLLSEAQRRGLDPAEENFLKLIDEGVGAGKFRGRLVRMDEGFNRSTVDVPNVNAVRLRSQTKAEIEVRKNAEIANTQRNYFEKLNDDLEKQTKLLDAESESFGKSTAEIERARKETELLNLAK